MGALDKVRVVEIGGLGPAPFAAMMLADHGAQVLRVERPTPEREGAIAVTEEQVVWDVTSRSRLSAGIDLKHPEGVALLLDCCLQADVLIEGFRPGVAERLGFGPEVVCARNPRLVYGRMTGWGQEGPWSQRAGHDLNYISLAGVAAHIGRAGQAPTPPLNLVGDYGGGGMLMVVGVLAALVERSFSGMGQIVDAAMVDGAALLMSPLYGAALSGFWSEERGTNLLDSGAPFYDCYQCADGRWLSLGAIEAHFFYRFCELAEIDPQLWDAHGDQQRWPELREAIAARLGSRSSDDWLATFGEEDVCVAPVLSMLEAIDHPHQRTRAGFVPVGSTVHPAPAPRLSRTPASVSIPPQPAGANSMEVLTQWGVAEDRITALMQAGVASGG